MSYYPDGAAGDPRAPYNQPDALPVRCDACDAESHGCEAGDACEDCHDGIYEEVEPLGPEDVR